MEGGGPREGDGAGDKAWGAPGGVFPGRVIVDSGRLCRLTYAHPDCGKHTINAPRGRGRGLVSALEEGVGAGRHPYYITARAGRERRTRTLKKRTNM